MISMLFILLLYKMYGMEECVIMQNGFVLILVPWIQDTPLPVCAPLLSCSKKIYIVYTSTDIKILITTLSYLVEDFNEFPLLLRDAPFGLLPEPTLDPDTFLGSECTSRDPTLYIR